MSRIRTLLRRHTVLAATAAVVLALTAGAAGVAVGAGDDTPPPRPLAEALHIAATAPDVPGFTAGVEFTERLIPDGALGPVTPLVDDATGELAMRSDGSFRLDMRSRAGEIQISSDGEVLTVYEPLTNSAYRLAGGPKPSEPEPGEAPSLARIEEGLERLSERLTLSDPRPGTVAGEPSYTLRVSPRNDGGLVGAAEVAWDAARGVPLRAALYAEGDPEPVLELELTDIEYGEVPASAVGPDLPDGARIVPLDDAGPAGESPDHAEKSLEGGEPVEGLRAVREAVSFDLAAPDELVGLERRSVRLVGGGSEPSALVTYGEGLGAIAVLQSPASGDAGEDGSDLPLPPISIEGATGTELATALGTLLTFERDGVRHVVVGSIPSVAAEQAARELR